MATIDIGKIKPVFKGTYDNSTAYVLDDIVYYNGSSYVAKTSTTGNLPTDATKWNVLASGSGGIWDSTLAIGSAGQVVRVSSGGALEFGQGSKGINLSYYENSTRATNTHNVTSRIAFWDLTFTKLYTNSKIMFSGMFPYSTESSSYPHCGIVGCRLSTTSYDNDGSDQNARWGYASVANEADSAQWSGGTWLYDSAGTNISGTGTIYMRNYLVSKSGSSVSGFKVYNPKVSDDNRAYDSYSYMTITEYEV